MERQKILSNIIMKLDTGKTTTCGQKWSWKDYAYEAYPWVCKMATQGTILINGKVVREKMMTCRKILVLSSKIRVFARIFWLHKSEASCYDSGKNQR